MEFNLHENVRRVVRRKGLWMRNPNNYSHMIPVNEGRDVHHKLVDAGWIEVWID